jgi:predicted site-specific integrase-resolvase
MELGGQWLSLIEYATRNDVSLSTLRRHIKARKLRYKSENGRYFLWDERAARNGGQLEIQSAAGAPATGPSRDSAHDQTFEELKHQLQKARKEIAELKTLVAFYEDQSESLRASS